jgi:hypothetical protein
MNNSLPTVSSLRVICLAGTTILEVFVEDGITTRDRIWRLAEALKGSQEQGDQLFDRGSCFRLDEAIVFLAVLLGPSSLGAVLHHASWTRDGSRPRGSQTMKQRPQTVGSSEHRDVRFRRRLYSNWSQGNEKATPIKILVEMKTSALTGYACGRCHIRERACGCHILDVQIIRSRA